MNFVTCSLLQYHDTFVLMMLSPQNTLTHSLAGRHGEITVLPLRARPEAIMATETTVKRGSGSRAYTAAPKDNTLPSHLHEAFKLLEIRFANYDQDGAETLMFKELERGLSLVGFSDPKLEATFKRFDFDGVSCRPRGKVARDLAATPGPGSQSHHRTACTAPSFSCGQAI
jgi:hypothetical protein